MNHGIPPPSRLSFWPRLRRYLKRPLPEKIRAVLSYVRHWIPGLPIPVRLPSGHWWLAWNNHLGEHLLEGRFEEADYTFVQRLLKPDMVILDIGANEGYYTLLASKCVGPGGRVIGFEPSSRERRRLRMNLWINCCTNVWVEGLALGAEEGQGNLHWL